ncbi:hypothetical protein V8F20_010673 [Naviculisporaceae sp. PSN 640]
MLKDIQSVNEAETIEYLSRIRGNIILLSKNLLRPQPSHPYHPPSHGQTTTTKPPPSSTTINEYNIGDADPDRGGPSTPRPASWSRSPRGHVLGLGHALEVAARVDGGNEQSAVALPRWTWRRLGTARRNARKQARSRREKETRTLTVPRGRGQWQEEEEAQGEQGLKGHKACGCHRATHGRPRRQEWWWMSIVAANGSSIKGLIGEPRFKGDIIIICHCISFR